VKEAAMARPFRFGLVAGRLSDDAALRAAVGAVELFGFDTLLLPDTAGGPAPLVTAASALAVSPSIRVGTYVLVAPLRAPRLIAWEARTLAGLSGGRFELGIGAGRPAAAGEAAAFGIDLGTPAERLRRVQETAEALREEQGAPPLLVAASGPRMLALAARVADTVALGLPPRAGDAELAAAADAIQAAVPDRSRPELALTLLLVGDGEAPPWLGRAAGADLAELRAGGALTVIPGDDEAVAAVLLDRRERFGVSYLAFGEHLAARMAPIAALLRGR
jgi:alkanesulfonate monooxygenase SsuD/methylene tetrahydromethanopterin reductase-like flavin-dependent oxidoreductase (luciferase family)